MNILLINKFLYPNGGSETYLFNLGKALEEAGHQVQYFGMEHEGRIVGNRVNAYTSDMEFHSGSALSKLTYPVKTIYSKEARQKIRLVLDDFQPDVCHLNNFNYQLTPSIILEIREWEKETGHPVQIVYTAHDYQLICPNHMLYNPLQHALCEKCVTEGFRSCFQGRCIHGSRARSLVGALEGSYWKKRETYKEINTVVCPSDFMKKKLDQCAELYGRTVTLHNFLDLATQSRENKEDRFENREGNRIEKKAGDEVSGDYVLYFGRFSEEKGMGTLLSAVRELPDIPFVFAGTGPLEDEVKELSNVRDLGFVRGEALYSLIRNARFTVYPSEWYENCPYSVMESQMLGTPVLASRIGGIPELVTDGISGELFTPSDAGELKEKISTLWNDPDRISFYRKGCRTISFDTSAQYCEKILAIYQGKDR